MTMGGQKLLLIEDQLDLAEPLAEGLRDHGFEVKHAANGTIARRLIDGGNWDLVILDLTLPDISGESLLTYLRQKADYPSVLILTARNTLRDKVSLFEQGCDDYLSKPYLFDELLARVHALLRRTRRVVSDACVYEDLVLDSATHTLKSDAHAVLLTPKEAALCGILMRHAGKIVSRREILEGVWGTTNDSMSGSIGVHIFNLRKKFAQLDKEGWFQTIRTSGFTLNKERVAETVH